MRNILLAVIASFVGLIAVAGASSAAPPDGVTVSYIVVLKDNVSNPGQAAQDIARQHGGSVGHVYQYALKGFAATLPAQAVSGIQHDPRVQFVSEDGTVTADLSTPILVSDSAPTGVRRIAAADTVLAHPASTVNVAVIDTGVDLAHPDLNAASGKNCVSPGAPAQDDNGHGTHVSGTIAAKNNGAGVVGVAPGTQLYAVKVLNSSGSGTWSQVICGIDWVTANAATLNIKVASMSLGGSGSNDNNCGNSNSDALHKAICGSTAAGVSYVVAAGNSGANLSGTVPAAYPEALTVTAMSDSDGTPGGTGGAPSCRTRESDDKYASFSNYAIAAGDAAHTIAGPGVCIKSTWLGGGYTTISGTSMATPHVSGTVALCISYGLCAGQTPSAIIQQLRSDAAAQPASYGFNGDPNHPVAARKGKNAATLYFGHLAYAGGY